MSDPLLTAWGGALPAVLKLMGTAERGMFRQELQRFCATARFQPAAADEAVPALRDLMLQAARAAQVPAAIHATRAADLDRAAMVRLCEHVMASWRDAEAAAGEGGRCDPSGMRGEVFFGPRLGGAGRPGAVSREDSD